MGSEHLSDEKLWRAAYGVPAAGEEQHLAACPACAATVAHMAAVREGARSRLEEALERLPAGFWERQRAAVRESAWRRQPAAGLRPAFVLSMVLLAALGVSLLGSRSPWRVPGARNQAQVQDGQLLQQVYQVASRIEPEALEPARLLLPEDAQKILGADSQPQRSDVFVAAATSDATFSLTVVARR